MNEELDAIAQRVPPDHVHVLSSQIVSVLVLYVTDGSTHANSEADNRHMTLKVHLPASYAETGEGSLSLEMKSSVLCNALIDKLLLKVKRHIAAMDGFGRVLAAYAKLKALLSESVLLCCYEEIKHIRKRCGKDMVSVKEAAGKVRVALQSGAYTTTLAMQVPTTYPAEIVAYRCVPSNLPARFLDIMRGLIENRIAVVRSKASFQVKKRQDKVVEEESVSKGDVLALKHDIRFLDQAHELRGRKDDKQSRRNLRRLAKAEMSKEALLEEGKTAESTAVSQGRTLEAVVDAAHVFFMKVTSQTCQVCMKRVLPRDPEKLVRREPGSKLYPERAHCGCWFHHDCLGAVLTEPPFLMICSHCDVRVTHNQWESDIKKLEKRWAVAEAREREMREAIEFLNLEEFT